MSGTTDQIKGKAKQATGVVTGDKQLEREGKLDRVAGSIKKTAEAVVDKVKAVLKPSRA